MATAVTHVAQVIAEAMPGDARSVLISIVGAQAPRARLQPGWADVLRLHFDDIKRDRPEAFQRAHAYQVIEFLDHWAPEVDRIVVHCAAGVSRSAAIARFAAERLGLGFDWSYDQYNCLVYATLHVVAAEYDGGYGG